MTQSLNSMARLDKPDRNASGGRAVVVAPFWREPWHIGRIRVAEFVGWLRDAGMQVVVVSAGPRDEAVDRDWGFEISIRDPLRLDWRTHSPTVDREVAPLASPASSWLAGPKNFASRLLNTLQTPDMEAAWAWRAARHPLVRDYARGAALVLSSNPPESAHLTAARLARRLGAKLIVDMRDGWLDYPLRTNLAGSQVRQLRERPLERRVLQQAAAIFVTSDVWREALIERHPDVASRTRLLTNGYADQTPYDVESRALPPSEMLLVYGGRFGGSRPGRRPDALLRPLVAALRERPHLQGVVECIGDYDAGECEALQSVSEQLRPLGWSLQQRSPLAAEQFAARLAAANGLLLLAASPATIPRKLFEYIPARRPILAVVPAHGAVARLAVDIPQLCPIVGDPSVDDAAWERFFRSCLAADCGARVPPRFGAAARRGIFYDAVGLPPAAAAARERSVA